MHRRIPSHSFPLVVLLTLFGSACDATEPGPSVGLGPDSGVAACSTAFDCPGVDSECGVRTCNAGVCGMLVLKQAGTQLASQRYGDCHVARCDAEGGVAQADDPDDRYDDGNPCTLDVCSQGAMLHLDQDAGFTCGPNGARCDDAGQCIYCRVGVAGDCAAGTVCVGSTNHLTLETIEEARNQCVPTSCVDGLKNGSETDVDCGGSACAPCATGKSCAATLDCAEVSCDYLGAAATHTCLAPTCYDGALNGAETGPDFGGPDCPPVPAYVVTMGCDAPSDCESGVCQGAMCRTPSCSDAVENGNEAGVDCGGSCATACIAP